jgi:hypothetical protein
MENSNFVISNINIKKRKNDEDDKPIYFTNNKINYYIKLIDNEYLQIKLLKDKINECKDNINKYQIILVKNCNHNKVPDYDCYDKTTYHCNICRQDL